MAIDNEPDRAARAKASEPPDPLHELTGKIIGSAYVVYRGFGYGFLEGVYRRALAVELAFRGVTVGEEVPYELYHRGVSVGFYRTDLVAERQVIVEVKRVWFSIRSQSLSCSTTSVQPTCRWGS